MLIQSGDVAEPVSLSHVGDPQLLEQARPVRLAVPSRQPPVFIAGMHRSGTSLTAHLLQRCGLWLGRKEELLAAAPSNPDGHFEHLAVNDVNDFLLNELGGGWDHVPRYPPDWPSAFPAQQERARRIHAGLARPTPWGWKDPRASLLMPFWLALQPAARVVICVRHPLEVAQSLWARGSTSYALGLTLWRDYNRRLIDEVPSTQRCVVHYEQLFAQPLETSRRLSEFAGVKPSIDRLTESASTVKPALRHSRFTGEQLDKTAVATDIIALYAALCNEAGWSGGFARPGRRDLASPKQVDLDALKYELFLEHWSRCLRRHTPEGARIAVVSRGDEELLRLPDRETWHFPRDERGSYLGYHPADSAEAITQLAAAHSAGAQFLALPPSSLWWLNYYEEFRRSLDEHFTRLETDRRIAVIYDLRSAP